MTEVTAAGIEILLHTLGLRDPEVKEPYRNFFVAGPGHADMPAIDELIKLGLMEENPWPLVWNENHDRLFLATTRGKAIALQQRPPKLTPGQLRYRRFLSVADAWPDLTFREFLTSPDLARYRSKTCTGLDNR